MKHLLIILSILLLSSPVIGQSKDDCLFKGVAGDEFGSRNDMDSLLNIQEECERSLKNTHKLKLEPNRGKKVKIENSEITQQISKSLQCPTTRPLGIIFPPTVMGNVSDSRKQILLNTLDEEISKCFDISPPTNVSSGDLPEVEDVFQLQIIEEDGDTQLSLRWTSGDNRKVETILCGGCKTFELNEKLVGLTGKLVGQRVGTVGFNKPIVKVKKKPVVKEKVYLSSIDPETGSRLYLSGMDKWKRKDCMEVTKLLPADDRLNYLKVCGVILVNKKEQQSKNSDKIWVNPNTGYRLNMSELDRKIERKECMEVAKLLPADERLQLLRGCGLIN